MTGMPWGARASFLTGALQATWMGTCLKQAMAFHRMSRQPVGLTQEAVLRDILHLGQDTAFGRAFGFARLRNAQDFQHRVPVHEYEDLRPWLLRMEAGEPNVLTPAEVTFFELSSGTASATKLIPYSAPLQRSFNRAVHPWLVDVYRRFRGAWGGPAYWVVTPPLVASRRTAGGIPIGFADDSDYFGSWGGWFLDRLAAVPEAVGRLPDLEQWRYATLLCLLRAEDLRLVSLWNPSFLPALLAHLPRLLGDLRGDLAQGTCCHGPFRDHPAAGKRFAGPPVSARAEALAEIGRGGADGLGTRLWPRLAVISCWTEAYAAPGLDELKRWFPGVSVQTKGVLATEAPVTIPMTGAPAPVLTATSGFYEFQEGAEGNGPIRGAGAVDPGGAYRVLLTTYGGLYRYPLHDIVQCAGFWRGLPCFRFVGKEAMVSDVRGEKLNSRHVESVLEQVFGKGSGAFLAPCLAVEPGLPGIPAGPPRYQLFLPAGPGRVDEGLAARVEGLLHENFHYRVCRDLGQLDACQIVPLACGPGELTQRRLGRYEGEHRRFSTAKLDALSRLPDWLPWLVSGPSA